MQEKKASGPKQSKPKEKPENPHHYEDFQNLLKKAAKPIKEQKQAS